MRSIYANYRASAGRILVRHDGVMVDMARRPIPGRCWRFGGGRWANVSQFLRVVPRVSALGIVAEAALR